jgi:hypothetical protein
MRRFLNGVSVITFAGLLVFGLVGNAAAQRPNSREVRDLVRSLKAKVEDLEYNLTYQMQSSSTSRQDIDDATSSFQNLKRAIETFEENQFQRRENRDDVNGIVEAAGDVDGFLRANRHNRAIGNGWSEVRGLIDRLAGQYGVTPDWGGRVSNARRDIPSDDDNYTPVRTSRPTNSTLTGTYTLDNQRSERVTDIIQNTNVPASQRQDLESKLTAPEMIAIDVRGDQVTLASSNASPITFKADGRETNEQSNGRTIRVRATIKGNDLTITSLGGETDYTVIFAAESGGRGLKVTRRITTDYLNETVFADSYYSKSDQVAGLGIESMQHQPDDDAYSSNDPADRQGGVGPNPILSQPRIGEFIVPNGAVLTGVLESEINTRVSQNNDRFKLTVQSPMEFRGAVIEGYISGVGRSGQISGRSNITFNFERITLRDGKVYDFAGSLQSIRDQNGKNVKVDTEGTAKGDSQTRETVKRGGIGAGLGALIGAIAGGGKGAAIGAIIGGGAGAGSVAVMGRDDVRLMPGSTLTIQSSSPINNDRPTDN